VAYREAITCSAEVDYTHRKQNGGVGQMARVRLRFEPHEEPGLVFENATVGGVIPKAFVPSIEKALGLAMQEGCLAGYPVLGLKATLVDGAFHAKDSSGLAFEQAAREAFRRGFAQAQPVLLEPVMRVVVTTPSDYVGPVIGDLQSRRGVVIASDMRMFGHEVSARAACQHVQLRQRAALLLAGAGELHNGLRPLRSVTEGSAGQSNSSGPIR
jgi:elongation factor G